MKKRTIAIVSTSLVLAILAVAVIATFPTYIFEDEPGIPATKPDVQSDNISENEDVGIVGGVTGGTQGILPSVDESIDKGDNSVTQPQLNSFNKLAEDDGAKLLAENGAFDKNVEFEVKKLGRLSKKYYRARYYVKDFAKNYTIYDITAKKDGKEVSPIGIAKVVIEIPENYNLDKVEVYYMLSDGGVQKLNSVIDKSARTATVSFMQSGVYILVEKDATATDNTSSEDNTSSTPSDSSDTSSGDSSSNTSSDSSNSGESTESDTSSDSTSSTESDPNKDSMDGWTPWF